MSKRIAYLFIATALAVLVLTACGGGPTATSAPSGQATTAAQPTTAAQAPTTAATTAPTTSATTAATAAATTAAGGTGTLRDPKQAALDAAGGKQLGGTVSVLATWGGNEQATFLSMVKPFEDATGVQVQYEGTRDLNAVLTTRVQGGNPPDLAGLPGPGQMAQFAQQGKLVDLSSVLDMNQMNQQYAKTWIDLGSVNGKPVGIFIKTSIKGLIWYNPKNYQAAGGPLPPKTYDELQKWADQMAASGKTPWCIGLENAAASGWPGTDWIEDFMLRQSGPDKYVQWYSGKLAWTSPEVKQAWQSFGHIATDPKQVYGGPATELTLAFGNGGDQLFKNPPGCYLHHQASFITDFFTQNNPGVKPVTDFDFFPFPDINPQYSGSAEVAGDLFGMFKNTPQSAALIKYLTTPEAQDIWVKAGGAISPNKLVPINTYPDPLSQKAAQVLVSAKTTVFDGSDQMPDAMNTAFWKAILDYVQNPTGLDGILSNLDQVQKDSYKP